MLPPSLPTVRVFRSSWGSTFSFPSSSCLHLYVTDTDFYWSSGDLIYGPVLVKVLGEDVSSICPPLRPSEQYLLDPVVFVLEQSYPSPESLVEYVGMVKYLFFRLRISTGSGVSSTTIVVLTLGPEDKRKVPRVGEFPTSPRS